MKIRMIEGHYGRETMDSDSDFFLESVFFPMTQTIPNSLDQGEQEIEIHDEEELNQWADEVFVTHIIWDMDVNLAACTDPGLADDLEEAARRLKGEAYGLRNDPLKNSVIQGYYAEARRLERKASHLKESKDIQDSTLEPTPA